MSATDVRTEARKDPDQLAREIDTTRANLGQTLDALQARLSPGQLLDEAMRTFRGPAGEFAHNLGTQVRNNPLPVALIGAGIAWLMTSQRAGATASSSTYEFSSGDYASTEQSAAGGGLRESVKEKAQAARERVSQAGSSVASAAGGIAQRVSSAAHRVGGAAGSAAGSARAVATRAGEGFGRMMDEQPLVLAALGVAVGAAIGAMLPASEREDRLLGEASDRAKERAKALGAEGYEMARERVQEGAETVRQSFAEKQQQQGGGEGGPAGTGGASAQGAQDIGGGMPRTPQPGL